IDERTVLARRSSAVDGECFAADADSTLQLQGRIVTNGCSGGGSTERGRILYIQDACANGRRPGVSVRAGECPGASSSFDEFAAGCTDNTGDAAVACARKSKIERRSGDRSTVC